MSGWNLPPGVTLDDINGTDTDDMACEGCGKQSPDNLFIECPDRIVDTVLCQDCADEAVLP